MLIQVRRKAIQKNIKKYSELRIVDWWNADIVSYIRKCSYLGNRRYAKKRTNKPFEHSNIQTDSLIPYYRVGDTTYNLIPCFSGIFTKGSNDPSDHNPIEEMKIEKSFLLGETEITQELYQSVMGGNPSWFGDNPKKPMEKVSSYDALIFCNKLSDMFKLERYYRITKDGQIVDTIETKQENYVVETNGNSKGFRLPTEWEWEYAAKAGTDLEYSGSNNANEVGWYDGNSKINGKETTQPVKQKKPNAWGFYDMSGNVWEWCENTYNSNDESILAYCIPRGGSWGYSAWSLRSTYRFSFPPSYRSIDIGFRVCRYI